MTLIVNDWQPAPGGPLMSLGLTDRNLRQCCTTATEAKTRRGGKDSALVESQAGNETTPSCTRQVYSGSFRRRPHKPRLDATGRRSLLR